MPEIGLPECSKEDRHKGMGKGETWETQGSPICETLLWTLLRGRLSAF